MDNKLNNSTSLINNIYEIFEESNSEEDINIEENNKKILIKENDKEELIEINKELKINNIIDEENESNIPISNTSHYPNTAIISDSPLHSPSKSIPSTQLNKTEINEIKEVKLNDTSKVINNLILMENPNEKEIYVEEKNYIGLNELKCTISTYKSSLDDRFNLLSPPLEGLTQTILTNDTDETMLDTNIDLDISKNIFSIKRLEEKEKEEKNKLMEKNNELKENNTKSESKDIVDNQNSEASEESVILNLSKSQFSQIQIINKEKEEEINDRKLISNNEMEGEEIVSFEDEKNSNIIDEEKKILDGEIKKNLKENLKKIMDEEEFQPLIDSLCSQSSIQPNIKLEKEYSERKRDSSLSTSTSIGTHCVISRSSTLKLDHLSPETASNIKKAFDSIGSTNNKNEMKNINGEIVDQSATLRDSCLEDILPKKRLNNEEINHKLKVYKENEDEINKSLSNIKEIIHNNFSQNDLPMTQGRTQISQMLDMESQFEVHFDSQAIENTLPSHISNRRADIISKNNLDYNQIINRLNNINLTFNNINSTLNPTELYYILKYNQLKTCRSKKLCIFLLIDALNFQLINNIDYDKYSQLLIKLDENMKASNGLRSDVETDNNNINLKKHLTQSQLRSYNITKNKRLYSKFNNKTHSNIICKPIENTNVSTKSTDTTSKTTYETTAIVTNTNVATANATTDNNVTDENVNNDDKIADNFNANNATDDNGILQTNKIDINNLSKSNLSGSIIPISSSTINSVKSTSSPLLTTDDIEKNNQLQKDCTLNDFSQTQTFSTLSPKIINKIKGSRGLVEPTILHEKNRLYWKTIDNGKST